MNYRLSLFEYMITIVLVIGALGLCYQYLGLSLTALVEQSFDTIPR